MASRSTISKSFPLVLLLCCLQVLALGFVVRSEISDTSFLKSRRYRERYRHLQACQQCNGKNIFITSAYTDASGEYKTVKVNSKDLSPSWVWENSVSGSHAFSKVEVGSEESSSRVVSGLEDIDRLSKGQSQEAGPIDPVKLRRQRLRQRRKERRVSELIHMSNETERKLEADAIERTKNFRPTNKRNYNIWRKQYQNPNTDSTLKIMKDQIIMAKVYASIARSKHNLDLYDSLMKNIKKSQHAISEANSDAELKPGSLEIAKAMGEALLKAKEALYDFDLISKKLRAMQQYSEESLNSLRKQNTFLIQQAAKTVPKQLHCLPLKLTNDYFFYNHTKKKASNKDKLEDPSLHHYAIFSDNVLATSVVVNSTAVHAKKPEEHVFHIVTDRLNFEAMKMWYIVNPPSIATVEVENIDEFKWLNSSYCSVLRQLESSRIKEYYFKANHPSSLSAGDENLKYRNPKYLSMLNHLRFYMPEVYPKLDKILFLDDDIVVQKDLTPLWSINMNGMVNGAVETCKESFHRFDTYLNFSNPKISENFDPQACGWAFGMNILDLKEWKRQNITGIYHYWQDLNDDRKLWKLGSLPPGLITFYNLTYALDRRWHVLGLGYDSALNPLEIEKAAVIHYNGNYKPWLDLAIAKYRSYWSKYVKLDDSYIRSCDINFSLS